MKASTIVIVGVATFITGVIAPAPGIRARAAEHSNDIASGQLARGVRASAKSDAAAVVAQRQAPPICEPELLPVEDLLVTSARVFIELASEEPARGPAGRGYPFTSVRGVFRHSDQLDRFAEAGRMTRSAASAILQLIDFECQRQQLTAAGEWTDWAAIDTQIFRDVINGSAGLSPDIISPQVTDSAITCPLPQRLTGQWNSSAVHPRLADFVMSEDELLRELDFQQAWNAAKAWTLPPGEAAGRILQEVPADLREVLTLDWITERLQASGDVRLFRYLDFDVVPGATYRYRVRLVLTNPNYQQPVERAADPAVVAGEIRITPWSEPTQPVYVEELTRYFLNDVIHSEDGTPSAALMQLFQYDPQLGTMVSGAVRVDAGQLIGGTLDDARTIDAASGEIRVGEYRFSTQDVLLDVIPAPEFDADVHPDLQLSDSGVWMVIATPDNGLLTIDRASQSADLERLQRYQEHQDQYFHALPLRR
jgi:hypothetical protein